VIPFTKLWPHEPIKRDQIEEIERLIRNLGWTDTQRQNILSKTGSKSFSELSRTRGAEIISRILAKYPRAIHPKEDPSPLFVGDDDDNQCDDE
jgi:hypothetical protein